MEKYLAPVAANGGSVENVDIWGKRRLAYDILKRSEGIYVVIDMTTTLGLRGGVGSVSVGAQELRTENGLVDAHAAVDLESDLGGRGHVDDGRRCPQNA